MKINILTPKELWKYIGLVDKIFFPLAYYIYLIEYLFDTKIIWDNEIVSIREKSKELKGKKDE